MSDATATKNYEIMLLLTEDFSEEEAQKEIAKIKKIVTDAGGDVSFDDFWGRRKLAYPINNNENGYYHVFIFSIDGDFLAEFEKNLGLNKNVLRHLISTTPKNYKPLTGAEVEAMEDEYYDSMRALKAIGGRGRGKKSAQKAVVKKEEKTLTEADSEKEGDETKEERAKKLDKILSDDLNL